jgi:hypothetical protein
MSPSVQPKLSTMLIFIINGALELNFIRILKTPIWTISDRSQHCLAFFDKIYIIFLAKLRTQIDNFTYFCMFLLHLNTTNHKKCFSSYPRCLCKLIFTLFASKTVNFDPRKKHFLTKLTNHLRQLLMDCSSIIFSTEHRNSKNY